MMKRNNFKGLELHRFPHHLHIICQQIHCSLRFSPQTKNRVAKPQNLKIIKKKSSIYSYNIQSLCKILHFYPIVRETDRELFILWRRRRRQHGRWRRWAKSYGHGGFRYSEETQLIFKWFIFSLIMSSSRLFLWLKPLFWSQLSVSSYSVVGVMYDFFIFLFGCFLVPTTEVRRMWNTEFVDSTFLFFFLFCILI